MNMADHSRSVAAFDRARLLIPGGVTGLEADSIGALWAIDGARRAVRIDPSRARATVLSLPVAPRPSVNCILALSGGFVAIGSADGMGIADSSGVRAWHRADPADPRSLGGNSVSWIAPDRSGGLWIGTLGGGVSRFDPRGVALIVRKKQAPGFTHGGISWCRR